MVPTSYTDIKNQTVSTNQFSVTEHFRQSDIAAGQNLPGVFFFYDLSPIKVWTPSCTLSPLFCTRPMLPAQAQAAFQYVQETAISVSHCPI